MSASSSVTTNGLSGCSAAQRRDQRGHGERAQSLIEPPRSIRRRSGLPLDSMGSSSGASTRNRRGTLYAESRARRPLTDARRDRGRRRVRRGPRRRRPGRARRRGGRTPCAPRPPVTSRSAASTSRGDTFAPAVLIMSPRRPEEVEEAVVVDAEEVAGPVPPVGGEHLVRARARSSPPSASGPRNHSSPTSPARPSSRVSGSTTRASSPGTGRPNEPRRCSGWSVSSGSSGTRCRSRSCRACCGGAPGRAGGSRRACIGYRFPRADRREVARRRSSGRATSARDRRGEPVRRARALALDEVERLGRVGRRPSTGGSRRPRARRRCCTRARRPRTSASSRTAAPPGRGRAAGSGCSRWPSSEPCSWITPFGRAGRTRGVHDHHAVVGRHVVLDRVEHRVRHRRRASAFEHGERRRATRHGGAAQERRASATGVAPVTDRPQLVVQRGRRSRCRGTTARRAAGRRRRGRAGHASSRARRERADRHAIGADPRGRPATPTTKSTPVG